MSKKQKIAIDPDDIHAAQTAALAEEIVRLENELDNERESRQALQHQVDDLREAMTKVSTSIDLTPPAPAPLDRPMVEVDGVQYRFKSGAFIIGGRRLLAEDVAGNPQQLAEIFGKYPGLFQQVG